MTVYILSASVCRIYLMCIMARRTGKLEIFLGFILALAGCGGNVFI